jgi:hypothetical protein
MTAPANKSSIDFLLSSTQDMDICSVEPRTAPATNNPRRRTIKRPKDPKLSLELLQQPVHAKVSTRPSGRVFFSEHRPIHPPPILQLKVEGFRPKQEGILTDDLINSLSSHTDSKSTERLEELEIIKRMRTNKVPPWAHYSTFFVVARLLVVRDPQNKATLQNDDLLIGTNVASGMPIPLRINSSSTNHLNHLLPLEKMDPNNFAITFVFSDLAVRKVGKFQLKFDLFEVFKGKVSWRSELLSDEFQIFTPKKFPGSTVTSPLASFLYNHGVRIRQRKRSASKREPSDELELPPHSTQHGKVEKLNIHKQRRFSPPLDSKRVVQSLQLPSVTYFTERPQQQHVVLPSIIHAYSPFPQHLTHPQQPQQMLYASQPRIDPTSNIQVLPLYSQHYSSNQQMMYYPPPLNTCDNTSSEEPQVPKSDKSAQQNSYPSWGSR